MASPCELHVATTDRQTAECALAVAAAEAARIEAKYSRYRRGNVVHAINEACGRTVTLDEETARLIDYAQALYALSDGKFDVTSGVLREVWRFDGGSRVPDSAAVRALLGRIGWQHVRWERPRLTLPSGMQVDLGGIGKEYAVDRAAAAIEHIAPRSLLNFGGDLRALGPPDSGQPWIVGIEAPSGEPGAAAPRIELTRGGLATSGDARRFVLHDGKRLGHILDPRTGWPVEGAPRSVTVAAPTCCEAGMLATFAMLHGAQAESFLAAQGVASWCLR